MRLTDSILEFLGMALLRFVVLFGILACLAIVGGLFVVLFRCL